MSVASTAPVHPPGKILGLALVPMIIALLLVPIDSFGAWVSGYLLSTFGTVGFVALYRYRDNRRSLDPEYVSSDLLRRAELGVLLAGLVVAMANAFRVATELAKVKGT